LISQMLAYKSAGWLALFPGSLLQAVCTNRSLGMNVDCVAFPVLSENVCSFIRSLTQQTFITKCLVLWNTKINNPSDLESPLLCQATTKVTLN